MQIPMNIIARMKSDFPTKFGIPRQSGLVDSLRSTIVFEPEYRNADALRGLEDFSHLWIIWQFSEAVRPAWSPTVRPPRLGGNTRMGVFATRSPFRPNEIGLSCVKLIGIEQTKDMGSVIHVAGADLMDGTPILDIKPYIPYSDCYPEATGGFTDHAGNFLLEVICPEHLLNTIPENKRPALLGVLSHDPRPSYQKDSERVYGLEFANFNIRFQVQNKVLTVTEITKKP
ncbi:MAG: tRNA (N6-threonylcarbamoyladenosine(37)-N6)-methyltransferase TrmO [Oscillospiraceae bacterium]|nr:tRNA (N6-threonylcarbamoyladenosine(37)-N6)-methyltransferase TrmO [Oscillospiraceae bacterium]